MNQAADVKLHILEMKENLEDNGGDVVAELKSQKVNNSHLLSIGVDRILLLLLLPLWVNGE